MTQGTRLPHLERGLYEALSGIANVVTWARGEQPRTTGSLLVLRLLSPPTARGRFGGQVKPRCTRVDLAFSGATEGQRAIVEIDGVCYTRDVPAASTITAERDAWLGLVTAGESGRITASAVGADVLRLEPVSITDLWRVVILGGELDGAATHLGAVRVDQREESATLELQAFARGPKLAASAGAILTEAQARLTDERTARTLANWGVGIGAWLSDPQDLSAIAGGSWETRAAITVGLNLRSAYVDPRDRLEEIAPTIEAP